MNSLDRQHQGVLSFGPVAGKYVPRPNFNAVDNGPARAPRSYKRFSSAKRLKARASHPVTR
jgi:hypothetical protein